MTWVLAGLLGVLAIAGFSLPWWWRRFTARIQESRRSANIAAYRSRLDEIEVEAAAHLATADAVEEIRQETAARLVEDAAVEQPVRVRPATGKGIAIGSAIGLVLFATAWYALAGSWRTQSLVALSERDPVAARSASMEQMVERLETHVRREPDDPEAWAWLGRAYRMQGRKMRAAEALGRANQLGGSQDPDLLVEEGEVLAQLEDGAYFGAAVDRFQRALSLSPEHPRALWYAGLAALQSGDHAQALRYWERLSRQELSDTVRQNLEHGIAGLRQRLGASAEVAPAPFGMDLEVRLAQGLREAVRPGAVLFLIARDGTAGGPPLAARRLEIGEFPLRTRLDDSHSMMSTRRLSDADGWRLVARVSQSGTAEPQSGDLEGEVELGRGEVGGLHRIEIDRQRP
jgi:cytochrome c-type biogenesis protein CcmH